MILLRSFLLLGLLTLANNLFAQVVQLSSGLEQDIVFTPNVTVSFAVTLQNTSAVETVVSIEPVISNSSYQFLGGSYPGVGGDCNTSLVPSQTCNVFLETTPLGSGDHDNYLAFDYALFSIGGAFPPPAEQTEIKIDGYSLDASYSLAPEIISIERDNIKINTNSTIFINGAYLTPSTTVSIPGLSVTNLNFISSSQISFDVNPGPAAGLYDVIVTNELDSITMSNALEVKANLWVDLRTAAGVTEASPVYETTRINGYTINPSFGMQLDVATDDWRKALRFDGMCSGINNDFDIVVYRTGTALRAMFGLTSTSTAINPSAGGSYHRRQYVGLFNTAGRVNRAHGSQRFEVGGTSWSQAFSNINTPVGMFIRYHFKNAGQSGNVVEVWQVDSAFNDIALLGSYTSNKPVTPATQVCPSVVPRENGIADYYITAIRYE